MSESYKQMSFPHTILTYLPFNKIILKPENFAFLPKSCDCERIKILAYYLGQVCLQLTEANI